MLNTQISLPKQILLRLPEDLADKLARAVPPRQRTAFLTELVRRELEQQDRQIVAACDALNALEAADVEFANAGKDWLDADLTRSADGGNANFDAETFSREAAIAQAALK